LKCSELIEEKAHAAAAKAICPMSIFVSISKGNIYCCTILIHKDERVLEFLVYEGKDKKMW
jgi:hypothetical protein